MRNPTSEFDMRETQQDLGKYPHQKKMKWRRIHVQSSCTAYFVTHVNTHSCDLLNLSKPIEKNSTELHRREIKKEEEKKLICHKKKK